MAKKIDTEKYVYNVLFALGHEGGHDEVDDQSEEDERRAVAPGEAVEPDHQLGKGPGYDFSK